MLTKKLSSLIRSNCNRSYLSKRRAICLFAILAISLAANLRAAKSDALKFRAAANNGFEFNTGVLRGALRPGGKSDGLMSVVHIPSGTSLDRSKGLFGFYRMFTSNNRFGRGGAWDLESSAKLQIDGSVEAFWPAATNRPFEIRAIYRWADPSSLDLEVKIKALDALPKFELFLASYFNEAFTNSGVLAKEKDSRRAEFVRAREEFGVWQCFPRDEAAEKIVGDGRWKFPPSPVDWTMRNNYALPLGFRKNATNGLFVLMMARRDDAFAVLTPHETEKHNSFYFSLFGRDLKSGEFASARARFVVVPELNDEQAIELYKRFSAEAVRPQKQVTEARKLSLAGTWQFQLDRNDAGLNERWFEKNLPGKIKLPGALQNQGFGDDISTNTPWMGDIYDKSWFTAPEYEKYRQPGNIKIPFWLQPEKYYAGAAWYQREISIPKRWRGQRVLLTLERPHFETRVWIDGTPIGIQNSLGTPHEYDMGTLTPGKHRLSIRVDNRAVVEVGKNSHSVTDHTQGNWNGIVGQISLRTTPQVWIENLQVFPSVTGKRARVTATFRNATGQQAEGKISLFVEAAKNSPALHALPVSMNFRTSETNLPLDMEIDLGEQAKTWDEFSPALYKLTAEIRGEVAGKVFEQKESATFGLREMGTEGTQFTINGRKIFFRGTLECCIFPLTGYPPTDVFSWKRIIRIAKAHGLNLLRFHSWCPPEAAFVAADELGFYFQIECSSWANQGTELGDGAPIDAWLYDEGERILKNFGNHPSFVLLLYGNEPSGKNSANYLGKWVNHFKSKATGQLVSSGAGWPEIPENQFHVTPAPRVQHWGAGLKSRINAKPPETITDYRDFIEKRPVPVISHEIGEWCVYPNFNEIEKYNGHLKARNFEIFRDRLQEHHMLDQAHDFLMASGKLQAVCYKEDIESALRTPGMGGFELLDLHDFPGQGTALVGVLDPFWESKGYITAQEYSRFCNSVVPLARLKKRVFTSDEIFSADIEIANFGLGVLKNGKAVWKLADEKGNFVALGDLPARDVPVGNGISLGHVGTDLKNFPSPAKYKFIVSLAGTKFENDWDIWVYPSKVETNTPLEVKVFHELNDDAVENLNHGEKVLLLIPPAQVKGDGLGKVQIGFSSIFWNTAWTRRQAPHTLGILCDPKNPALAGFPTDFHSNFQWWYLLSQSSPIILENLPTDLRPVVQVIDDWVTNRRLGLVFEARLGSGKLLVCSIDLQKSLETNPVARQMLNSLLGYMAGKKFDPKNHCSVEQLRALAGSSKGS